jgi:hypothetical protein
LFHFWQEVSDDHLVQAQEDYLSLRANRLGEFMHLLDEERAESGVVTQAIRPHTASVGNPAWWHRSSAVTGSDSLLLV